MGGAAVVLPDGAAWAPYCVPCKWRLPRRLDGNAGNVGAVRMKADETKSQTEGRNKRRQVG